VYEPLEDRFLLSFSPAVNYPVGLSPWAVATSDFNGDGKPDLAVANFSSNTVSILLGKGDGTFQPAQNYATGPGPRSLA
jgi:DNA-binding beta-propeller fold protein YncE